MNLSSPLNNNWAPLGSALPDNRDAMCKNSKQDWWRKSVVRRSTSSIDHDLEYTLDQSKFLQQHAKDDHCAKGIAVFERSEVIVGELLGKGSFSQVSEIVGIQLSPETSRRCTPEQIELREHFAATIFKDGKARFCIKHLQERLIQSPKDFQVAASDLVIEAAYMSALQHPNILSVRGLPVAGLKAWGDGKFDGFFVIFDRLDTTLDNMIHEWKTNDISLEQKLAYAMQLADALETLHKHRIVFRDLKPSNAGFANGSLQLFDFGLCRELPEENYQDLYEMSGVGTRRYMAPEAVISGCYNVKADVYSWSMIFWEMLSLTKPYATYSTTVHHRKVCRGGERPEFGATWPSWIRSLLRSSWEESVDDRHSMKDVCFVLRTHIHRENVHAGRSRKHELCITNHDKIVKDKPSIPDSPAAVFDFPMTTTDSCDGMPTYDSVDLIDSVDHFLELYSDEPPTPPKKPVAYLELPEIAIKTISLDFCDLDASDDDLSGFHSLEDEHSFAGDHSEDPEDMMLMTCPPHL